MRNKYKEKINEYLTNYKHQLKDTPKYKDIKNIRLVTFQREIYDMNPVYYNLMGKIELAEKLLIDLDVRKKQ
jgi:hypothetical protein|tara:strand:- start:929 stop:1144 length:216 start_codon:yes stop_codon:yes gene_type:complete